MINRELFVLFEKQYFHELEVKERLTNRVQISFALLVGEYTVISYMLRTVDQTRNLYVVISFYLLTVLTIGLSACATRLLLKAFRGNVYEGIPLASDTESHHKSLIEHKIAVKKYNKDYPDADRQEINIEEEIDDYLYRQYKERSSKNSIINENRMDWIHDSFGWLLYSAIPLALSCLLFVLVDLDVSSPRQSQDIHDAKVVQAVDNLNLTLQKIDQTQQEATKWLTTTDRITRHHQSDLSHHQYDTSMKTKSPMSKEEVMSEDDKKPAPSPPSPPVEPSARLIKDGSDKTTSR